MLQYMMRILVALSLILIQLLSAADDTVNIDKPNILFILFDDLGWNDISYNGGRYPTPRIDELFENGVNLRRHYIHLLCSMSRSQFLTGRYGMYSGYGKMSAFRAGSLGGIPIGLPTIAQWLKETTDYTTYGVGKWHLGYAIPEYLPKSKGFDHFFGFYQGKITYDEGKIIARKCNGCNGDRYDLHDDGQDYNEWLLKLQEYGDSNTVNTLYEYTDYTLKYIEGEALTDTPWFMYLSMQSPHGPLTIINSYHSICLDLVGSKSIDHRKYCQVILASDDMIGKIIDKLKETNQWDNSMIILSTDNGADLEITGCNYPFRGTKGTLFEGNQRVVTVVSGGIIDESQRGTDRLSLFSSLDWTPTILDIIGIYHRISDSDKTWDGISQKNLILYGDDYTDRIDRDHIVFNIGLRNLDSATVIFKYPDDNNKIYKYIAQNEKIEKEQYHTKCLDGWCVPDPFDEGEWILIVNDPDSTDLDPATQALNDKFIFDLEEDVGENINLLIRNIDNKYDIDNLIKYATEIFKPYLENELFSQHIGGLWEYYSDEDRTKYGEYFIHSFMNKDKYLQLMDMAFDKEESQRDNPISNSLRRLFSEEWKVPQLKSENNKLLIQLNKNINTTKHSSQSIWIIGVFILILSIIIIYRLYNRYFNKNKYDKYQSIPTPTKQNKEIEPLLQSQNITKFQCVL